MPKTLNYGRSETTDFKVLGALIFGFSVWDLSTLYFGAVALVFGINYTMLTSPEYQDSIDRIIRSAEDIASPISSNPTWKTVRPLAYLFMSILICVASVIIVF